jgi:hypothetical protein
VFGATRAAMTVGSAPVGNGRDASPTTLWPTRSYLTDVVVQMPSAPSVAKPQRDWRGVSSRLVATLAVAAVVIGAVKLTSLQAVSVVGSTGGANGPHHTPGLAALPLGARGPVSAALGADDRAFDVRAVGARRFTAASRPGGLSVAFRPAGALISAAGGTLSLALAAVDGARVSAASPVRAASNRVAYPYRSVREWFANGPLGVEQGFTVPRPLGGARLVLTLATRGLRPLQAGKDAVFAARSGRQVIRYSGLYARDARGRRLPASLSISGATVRLVVGVHGRVPSGCRPLCQLRVAGLE